MKILNNNLEVCQGAKGCCDNKNKELKDKNNTLKKDGHKKITTLTKDKNKTTTTPKNYLRIATFGGLYSKQSLPLKLKDGVIQQLVLPLKMSSSNVTLGNNVITILENGVYKITSFVSMKTTDQNSLPIFFSTRKNKNHLDDLFHKLLVGNSFQEISCTTITPLQAGDIIELIIYSSKKGKISFGIGLSASLIVVKVE